MESIRQERHFERQRIAQTVGANPRLPSVWAREIETQTSLAEILTLPLGPAGDPIQNEYGVVIRSIPGIDATPDY